MISYISVLLVLAMILVSCSGNEGLLTRVDVQVANEEGNDEDVVTITDKDEMDLIKKSYKHVKWEPNTEAKMARKEDLLVTLFYTLDKNMPERVFEYKIWFNENETATMISNHENEGYGTLDQQNSRNLKNVLLK